MKLSVIEEIGPIELQAGSREAATGEKAEINNNYKTAQYNSVKHKYNYNPNTNMYKYVKYKNNNNKTVQQNTVKCSENTNTIKRHRLKSPDRVVTCTILYIYPQTSKSEIGM